MQKRMRVFVRALIHQCNKFSLPCELIVVEWNPPEHAPPLKDVLPRVKKDDYLSIRYVRVPPSLHRQLAFSEQLPLFQMIAKNVGIRRAKANFVLCTNVDIIFSDELFAELSKRDLREDCFYRANRCDVPNTLEESWTVEQQIAFCKANIKKRLGKNSDYANFTHTGGFMFRYWIFQPLLKLLSRVKAMYAHSLTDRLDALDMDACGDFTLMSKAGWEKIQGYPELEIYSIHIDSMGVLAAEAAGLKQVIFKWTECTYHMEHSGGWEFSNPIEKIHFYTKKPMLDWWTVREAGLHIMQHRSTFNLNRPDWGFHHLQLEELEG